MWADLAVAVLVAGDATDSLPALDEVLLFRTFLVGYALSFADIALGAAIRAVRPDTLPPSVARWMRLIPGSAPAVVAPVADRAAAKGGKGGKGGKAAKGGKADQKGKAGKGGKADKNAAKGKAGARVLQCLCAWVVGFTVRSPVDTRVVGQLRAPAPAPVLALEPAKRRLAPRKPFCGTSRTRCLAKSSPAFRRSRQGTWYVIHAGFFFSPTPC